MAKIDSICRNLALNGAAVGAQRLLLAGRQLIVVPFFIAAWGPSGYGNWLTLSAIPSAVALGNLGLGTACANSFVIAHAEGDLDGASRAMRCGQLMLSLAISTVLGLAVFALAMPYTRSILFRFIESAPLIALSGVLLCLETLLGFFTPLGEAWYRAARKAHIATNTQSACSIVTATLSIGALALGKNMAWIAAIQCASSVAMLWYLHFNGRRLLPEVSMRRQELQPAELWLYFRKGAAFMLAPARQALSIQGTLFVTRIYAGAEGVALLGTMRTLANSNLQIFNGINAAIFPELQVALASRRIDTARLLYIAGIAFSVLIALIGCLFIWIFGPWVYLHWTRGELQPNGSLWLILIAIICCNALWWVPAATLRAINQPEQIGLIGILAALCGLTCSVILSTRGNVAGALLGVVAMELIMAIWIIPKTCAILGLSPWKLPVEIWNLKNSVLGVVWNRGSTPNEIGAPKSHGPNPMTKDQT